MDKYFTFLRMRQSSFFANLSLFTGRRQSLLPQNRLTGFNLGNSILSSRERGITMTKVSFSRDEYWPLIKQLVNMLICVATLVVKHLRGVDLPAQSFC